MNEPNIGIKVLHIQSHPSVRSMCWKGCQDAKWNTLDDLSLLKRHARKTVLFWGQVLIKHCFYSSKVKNQNISPLLLFVIVCWCVYYFTRQLTLFKTCCSFLVKGKILKNLMQDSTFAHINLNSMMFQCRSLYDILIKLLSC